MPRPTAPAQHADHPLAPPGSITAPVERLIWAGFPEDPRDLVAKALRQAAAGFGADARAFAAWYLFGHGAIKFAPVIAVLADRWWA